MEPQTDEIKKDYIAPECEIEKIEIEDIITTSDGGNDNDPEGKDII